MPPSQGGPLYTNPFYSQRGLQQSWRLMNVRFPHLKQILWEAQNSNLEAPKISNLDAPKIQTSKPPKIRTTPPAKEVGHLLQRRRGTSCKRRWGHHMCTHMQVAKQRWMALLPTKQP